MKAFLIVLGVAVVVLGFVAFFLAWNMYMCFAEVEAAVLKVAAEENIELGFPMFLDPFYGKLALAALFIVVLAVLLVALLKK